MRILQVCSARTLGGGERHVAALCNSLVQRGHQIYAVVAPRSPLIEKLSSVPYENIHTIRMRNAFDIPSALRLARFVREKEIDIVHAHIARDYPLAALAVRRYAKLVVTRHVLFPLSRLHKLTLSRVSRVIAVSQAVASQLKSQRICDEKKIHVIENGIDLTRFVVALSESEKASLRDRLNLKRPLLIGTVGSYLPMKGHEDFIRAAAILAKQRDDVDFVIVGDNDARNRDYRSRLERMIEDIGLQDKLSLVNWTSDLAPFYSTLDIYVSSSHSEAFGLSIVEAMASGKAVVATATEGAKEILDDGVTGAIIPVRDPLRASETIASLLDDSNQRNRIGLSAREFARQHFGLERMTDSVEQLYHEVLSSEL